MYAQKTREWLANVVRLQDGSLGLSLSDQLVGELELNEGDKVAVEKVRQWYEVGKVDQAYQVAE